MLKSSEIFINVTIKSQKHVDTCIKSVRGQTFYSY